MPHRSIVSTVKLYLQYLPSFSESFLGPSGRLLYFLILSKDYSCYLSVLGARGWAVEQSKKNFRELSF